MVPGDHVFFFPLGSSEASGAFYSALSLGLLHSKTLQMTEYNHSVYFLKIDGKDGLTGPL